MIIGSLLLILVAIVLAVLGVARGSDPLLVGSILASLLTAVTLAVSARQSAAARLAAGQDVLTLPFVPARRRRSRTGGTPSEPVVEAVDAPAANGAGTVFRRGTEADGEDSVAPGETLVEEAPAQAGAEPVPDEVEQPARPVGSVTIPSQAGPSEVETDGPIVTVPAGPGDSRRLELDLRPEADGDDLDLPDDLVTTPVFVDEDTLAGLGADEDPLDEPPAQLVPPADAAVVARLETDVMVVDGRPRYHLTNCVHLLGREFEALPVREAVELGFTPCSLCEPDTTLLAQARRS